MDRCRFSHAGCWSSGDAAGAARGPGRLRLAAELPERPSVVVRQRLADRHRRAAGELDVRISRPPVTGPDGAAAASRCSR
ncbi:hypothetical protein GXW82_42535 [Streptacidiphilus sp. 4-A2]|nr:hypothetical protein [Streptacidiphilus sp. 4-A2]